MTFDSAKRPRVCLVTFGSAGDVHPMLSLGKQLRARGHEVSLLTNPAFATAAASNELDFEPVGEERHYLDTVDHPKLWHPIDGFGVMWRYLLRPALAPTYERLRALAAVGPCVVIASPVAMGARVAQEHLGLPLVTAYTAATMLRTVSDPMTLARWRVPRWTPTSLRRLAWTALDHYKLEPLVRPALDVLRGQLGLTPIDGSVFGHWMHSPVAGVALFPSWFAQAAPDWPAQVIQTSFSLYEADAAQPDPAGLEEFLREGPAPVVFMPGTAQSRAHDYFKAALGACAANGQRGVLLGAVSRDVSSGQSRDIYAASYAAFSRLLPRARALVHHGGIGSCAQALRAGIPQLVLPRAYDQFDNAMRVERLGVGISLPGRDAVEDLQTGLRRLLAAPSFAPACAHWSSVTTPHLAHAALARLVERFA